jgi:hypothetical protein
MNSSTYNIKIRIPAVIHVEMLNDLKRSHPHAFERVGFLFTTSKILACGDMLVLAKKYCPVADEDYVKDSSVGARINSDAIRKSMQEIFTTKCGCFHVHLHNHSGIPSPSFTDITSLPSVAQSFSNISGNQVNGIMILSNDGFYVDVKLKDNVSFIKPSVISVVGFPMIFQYQIKDKIRRTNFYDRQSFLGENSQFLFEHVKVAIIGYGGGGSHFGQQLAYIGVKNVSVFDSDFIEDTNINRLIGGWFSDLKRGLSKIFIAKRTIKKILPSAKVICINSRWQENPEMLQTQDVVLGSVDSYAERQQLEAECRRYLIPYIDIGMDVHKIEDGLLSMAGQIILSMPFRPCMNCLGFLTEEKLGLEAKRYGATGGRPQVVWSNGVLASTAIGIFVDLLTGWTKEKDKDFYLSYDGNSGKIIDHIRLKLSATKCGHYPLSEVGNPVFTKL